MPTLLDTLAGFRVMQQDGDLLRLRNEDTGRECVLRWSESAHQVYSVGPDCPDGGGQWHANATPEGIRYVASFISPAAARRRFKAEQALWAASL